MNFESTSQTSVEIILNCGFLSQKLVENNIPGKRIKSQERKKEKGLVGPCTFLKFHSCEEVSDVVKETLAQMVICRRQREKIQHCGSMESLPFSKEPDTDEDE